MVVRREKRLQVGTRIRQNICLHKHLRGVKKREEKLKVLHNFHRVFHRKTEKTPCSNRATGENTVEKRGFDKVRKNAISFT